MTIRNSLTAIAASLLLYACSGDGSGNITQPAAEPTAEPPPDPTYSLSGKVIDGYVSGATVWIDFNNNGVQEADEPSAVSGDAGNYSLELTETQRQCAQYSTLYVDVPVGAMDEDLGEVTEAYQMVRPPVLDAITDDTLLHISPLTTVLWQGIQDALSGMTVSNCETLVADQAEREGVRQLIEDSVYNTVSFHNLSADEIFEDFIASGNDETKAYAQTIVQGLQKSFAYVKEVEAEFPSADEIRVVHYYGTDELYPDDSDEHWFRRVVVFVGDDFHSREYMVPDSAEAPPKLLAYRDAIDSDWGEGTFTSTITVVYYGEKNGYFCSYQERVSVIDDGIEYGLSNRERESAPFISSAEECQSLDLSMVPVYRAYDVSYTDNGRSYLADMHQATGTINVLPHWVNFNDRSSEFDFDELIAELSVSGYQFREPVLITSDYWYKREDWYDGDTYYQISYYSNGDWERFIRFADGTHTDECSYDEGQTWEACAG